MQLFTFDELQSRLVHMGGGDPLSMPGATVVVLPSLEVDRHVLARHADVLSACEERALYQLLLLRRPDLRLVFISSEPVDEHTIRGYVELLPASERNGARARLVTLSPDDASPRPLSEKLLERPDMVERLRDLVTDPTRAFMAPYAVTSAERELALRLGLPVYGTPPDQASWGTKSGARRLFAEERIAHPAGVDHVRTPEELAAAAAAVRVMRPAAAGAVVKLDGGIYGEGNRVLTFDDLPPTGGAAERDALARRIVALGDEYLGEVAASSAVVEELLTGSELHSPSV
ncbi:MAG TPA: hypothetical protein VFX51_12875, partial [Solirubrobacteraceae bacterium]|nr:hypothetical protein [Solirubrobacteraceae bacterium]